MSSPTFQSIFGDAWNQLPTVIHKHYANRPFSNDLTIVKGELDVMCAGPIKWLAPLMRFMGQIPPVNELQVPVLVHFHSSSESQDFHFKRSFKFKHHPLYSFHSKMRQVKGDEVVEVMRFGLCWRLFYRWQDDKVKLIHKGYAFQLFGYLIPLPLTILLGQGYAEETAIDDDTFDMITTITHPWWGQIYEYKGRFKVLQTPY